MIPKITQWFRQPGHCVLFLLIIATLVSAIHWRGLEAPYKGSAGNRIFPEGRHNLSLQDKFFRPLQVYTNIGENTETMHDTIRVFEWVQIGLWFGSLGFTLLLLCLTLTWRFWHPLTSLPPTETSLPPPKTRWRTGFQAPWWSLAALLIALLIAGGTRLPLLDRPILWDEQDNLRRNFHGYYDYKAADETPIWREATYKDAIWENARGNNPHLMSVLGQLSNDFWRKTNNLPRDRFNPTALRLPVALAAILGIAALWWMVNLMGWRLAAPLAALLAALHPLHAEYSIQARGYGFVLLFTPLALGAITVAWQRKSWRDFWLFGICLTLGLFAFPGSLYFAASVGIAAAIAFLYQWLKKNDLSARAALFRLCIVGILLAGVFAWLMAPTFPQMSTWMNAGFQKGHMPSWWYLTAYLTFATGLFFFFPGEYFRMPAGTTPSSAAWTFGPFFANSPLLAIWSIILFPIFITLGLAALWKQRQNRFPFLLATTTISSGFICIAHHALITGNYIYPWYAIFTLPTILAVIAISWENFSRWLKSRWIWGTVAGTAIAATMLAIFAGLTHPALEINRYNLDNANLARRPTPIRWKQPSPNEIGRTEMLRGNSMWIIYKDGLHVVYRDYKEQLDTIDQMIPRTTN